MSYLFLLIFLKFDDAKVQPFLILTKFFFRFNKINMLKLKENPYGVGVFFVFGRCY
jgi:hypothetical protein